MLRGGLLPKDPPNLLLQRLRKMMTGREFDKKYHSLIIFPALSHRQAVSHLFDLLQHTVDLRSTNSDARYLQHRIGSAVEGYPTSIAVKHHKVSVTPDIL